MPQACTVCRHDQVAEIDQLLVSGTSLRNIARRFGTSATALHRHRKHLASQVVKAKEAKQAADADTLLDRVKQLLSDAQRITAQAEQAKQLDIALRGIREVREVLELLARVSSELADQAKLPAIPFANLSREENEKRIQELLAKASYQGRVQ